MGLFSQAIKNTEKPELRRPIYTIKWNLFSFVVIVASSMKDPKGINISDIRGC